jgi:diguanylate cyclase (GGDEF)-like protein
MSGSVVERLYCRKLPTKNDMRRRRTDLHLIRNRRADGAPLGFVPQASHIRYPSVPEQAMQFLTRYLFATLGLIFFNFAPASAPVWLSIWHYNLVVALYLVINTAHLIHAQYRPRSPMRYRIALWVDVVMVTICVANDPNTIPPSLVAYIVVVLGNGMRYGIRFFAEALCATLIGAGVGLGARYWHLHSVFSEGTAFLSLFGGFIVVYAYILMARIERSRRHSEERSRTDALTGLLNRHGLSEAVETLASDKRWSVRQPVVVLADLDNFKQVNDTRGHAEGDRVLMEVASMLGRLLRSHDLIARYGGDEFVAVLADVETREAQLIVNRVQSEIETWFRQNNLSCGISIGFATASTDHWDLDLVLQSADRLLYESKFKRSGLNQKRVDQV